MTRADVEESRDPRPRRIDWAGQVTLAGGLFLLVLALLRGNEQGWGSTPIVAELRGAAVLLAAFVPSAQASGADDPAGPVPQPGLHRRPGRRRSRSPRRCSRCSST